MTFSLNEEFLRVPRGVSTDFESLVYSTKTWYGTCFAFFSTHHSSQNSRQHPQPASFTLRHINASTKTEGTGKEPLLPCTSLSLIHLHHKHSNSLHTLPQSLLLFPFNNVSFRNRFLFYVEIVRCGPVENYSPEPVLATPCRIFQLRSEDMESRLKVYHQGWLRRGSFCHDNSMPLYPE